MDRKEYLNGLSSNFKKLFIACLISILRVILKSIANYVPSISYIYIICGYIESIIILIALFSLAKYRTQYKRIAYLVLASYILSELSSLIDGEDISVFIIMISIIIFSVYAQIEMLKEHNSLCAEENAPCTTYWQETIKLFSGSLITIAICTGLMMVVRDELAIILVLILFMATIVLVVASVKEIIAIKKTCNFLKQQIDNYDSSIEETIDEVNEV